MKTRFKNHRNIYALGLGYLAIGYLATNEFAAANPWQRPALPIATALDHALPFTPWMVIFYAMYFPMLAFPMISESMKPLFRLTLAQVATQSLAFVVFILFPTPIERPPAVPVEGFAHQALDLLFRADHPYNTFPSMHVAQSVLLTLFLMSRQKESSALNARGPRLTVVTAVYATLSVLIIVSAVLIKQHYVADVMAGALLAWAMAGLFFERHPAHS